MFSKIMTSKLRFSVGEEGGVHRSRHFVFRRAISSPDFSTEIQRRDWAVVPRTPRRWRRRGRVSSR